MACSRYTAETLAILATKLHDSAAAYAMDRLLERRPDLDLPPGPRVEVPACEALRVSLDRLGFVAWLEQGLALACDVPVAAALRAGATWAQVADAVRCSVTEARERYDHLALIAAGDAATARPNGGAGR
jgi:hypothetical protein